MQRSAASARSSPRLTDSGYLEAGGSLAELPDNSEPDGSDTGTGYQRIQAVDRAVVLLKAVANSTTPPTVLELAHATDINRSTAWRLLRTLEYHGLVDRDSITQRYTMGYGAIPIAAAVTDDALVRRARPLLEDLVLQVGESVTLAVAKRFNLVYVDQVDPPDAIVPSWLNKPLPLHATSGGKVFLAWLRADERAAILPKELQRYTDRTITDRNPARRLHEIGRRATATAESVRALIA